MSSVFSWDKGFGGILSDLAGIARRTVDPRPVFNNAVQKLDAEQMRQAFATEGQTTAGGPWVPLRQKTAKYKHQGGRILVRGGDLERSYTNPRDQYHVHQARRLSVTMGSKHPIAGFHENGTRHLPRRSVRKTKAQEEELDELVWLYITEGVGGGD